MSRETRSHSNLPAHPPSLACPLRELRWTSPTHLDRREVVAPGRHDVLAAVAGNLDLRPLGPQVHARRRFDRVDDERAPDARGCLEKHEAIRTFRPIHLRSRVPCASYGGQARPT